MISVFEFEMLRFDTFTAQEPVHHILRYLIVIIISVPACQSSVVSLICNLESYHAFYRAATGPDNQCWKKSQC